MSNISNMERRKFGRLLEMGGRYVLDFSGLYQRTCHQPQSRGPKTTKFRPPYSITMGRKAVVPGRGRQKRLSETRLRPLSRATVAQCANASTMCGDAPDQALCRHSAARDRAPRQAWSRNRRRGRAQDRPAWRMPLSAALGCRPAFALDAAGCQCRSSPSHRAGVLLAVAVGP